MKKYTFGTPEEIVPSRFCREFHYEETPVSFSKDRFSFYPNGRGCVLEFPMSADTQVFGFGLQLKQFNHTYHRIVTRVNADPVSANGEGHAPVPFFVTNQGYGIYVDTARYAEFSCGVHKLSDDANVSDRELPATSTEELYAARQANSDIWMSIQIPAAKGVDIYVIEGDTITDIVSQYNRLSGGGPAVPEWGLGVFYRCCTRYDQDKVKETADYFRQNDIPCDIIGLEPGWQSRSYSCSFSWEQSRFPHPDQLIAYLRENGYHVNLWEHAFVHPDSPIFDDIKPYSGNYRVWNGAVPDFSLPKARQIFADHHRQVAVSLGVDGFKLDECDSSDNTGGWSFPLHAAFPSGMDGEQYHSLFGTLYAQAISESLDGAPTLSEIRNFGALAAPYPFVLYSDLYDHRDFVRGMTTSCMSGLLWTPEVRHAESRKDLIRRLQCAVFSVQCLINGWYCDDLPWKEFDCENEVRDLLKLRQSLVPMLKDAFDTYHTTGKPPIRSLVMDYTDDPQTYTIDDEYLFCDDLLVAPIIGTESDERDVYLPEGKWVDYFTGERVAAGRFTVHTEGIPVYKKIS